MKSSRISRRRALLAGSAGIVGAALPLGASQTQDTTKVQGPTGRDVGGRSPFEKPARMAFSPARTATFTPLQDLDGIITPADLHFERHHAGVPAIDPQQYSLLIHGMVDRPTIFTLAELKRFPGKSMIRFIECSGNGGRAYRLTTPTADLTPQQTDGLTSTSEWTGVLLSTLLREVGASPKARWVLAEGMDAAVMTRSVPIDIANDDALIAYGQNGEALRPEQGYPVRLMLPGVEGNASVKWLRRIEVADQPFMTREETSKYTDPLPDGVARHVQPGDGRQVADHRAGVPGQARRPRLARDPRAGVDWPRPHHARRGERRRRQDVAERHARRTRAAQVSYALPSALGVDRRGSRDHEPRDRRDRLRSADHRAVAEGAWTEHAVSLQQHPRLARRR